MLGPHYITNITFVVFVIGSAYVGSSQVRHECTCSRLCRALSRVPSTPPSTQAPKWNQVHPKCTPSAPPSAPECTHVCPKCACSVHPVCPECTPSAPPCAPSAPMCAPSEPAMGVPYNYMQHVLMQAALTPLPKAANTTPKYRVAGIAHRACMHLTRMFAILALWVIICILIARWGQCPPV